MLRRFAGAIGAILLAPAVQADSPVVFQDVSAARQLGAYTAPFGQGSGAAAADFDDDGDIDVFLPTAAGYPHRLYRNLGNGVFEEIAASANLDSTDAGRVALWFDYDGDHLLDLFVAGDCWQAAAACTDTSTIKLYRQVSPALFADVTLAANLTDDLVADTVIHRGGVCAGDISGDGYPELLISLWGGEARLFLNDTQGGFTEISNSSNIGGTPRSHWQPMMYDFTGDGRLDIYFAIDYANNRFWVNQGGNMFVDDAALSRMDNAMNDMGMSLNDYDNDGDVDIYVTNITEFAKHNILLRNDSTTSPRFAEIASDVFVANGYWAWGTTFFDADRDGLVDLAATNGYFLPPWSTDPSVFFLNQGGSPVTFADESASSQFNDTLWGSALMAIDADRDGDLDLLQTTVAEGTNASRLRLLDNTPAAGAPAHHYLCVKPRMPGPNYRAIGAVVRIVVGSTSMMRVISAGTSFLGQEPAEAFFGLGTATTVDSVTVDYPDGSSITLTDVAADQCITVSDTYTDTDGDGVEDGTDCLPTDGESWQLPGETSDLVLSRAGSTATLSWSAPVSPGASVLAYDTLASSSLADFGAAATCIEGGDADRTTDDSSALLAGEVRFYLTRAVNGCGAGTVGRTSGGLPRTAVGCP